MRAGRPWAYGFGMSLTVEDKVFVLQRFVNSYAQDLLVLHSALGDPTTPEEAKRFLIGGLNYALDKLDMFPDHRGGMGIADDAIVLRIAAKLARGAGAKYAALEALALDANNIINLFSDLAGPLEKLVMQFPKREVRGRNADKILSHNLSRAAFDADIANEAKRFTPEKIATKSNAARAIDELYRAMRDAIIRAGVQR
jgi:uncharacterized membrane protein YkvA (DUF1232 family)